MRVYPTQSAAIIADTVRTQLGLASDAVLALRDTDDIGHAMDGHSICLATTISHFNVIVHGQSVSKYGRLIVSA